MRLDERVQLARLAYARALANARQRPTPASWRRLLTAAKNLNGATRALEQVSSARIATRGPSRRGLTVRAKRHRQAAPLDLPRAAPAEPERGAAERSEPSFALPSPEVDRRRWPELVAELERARALLEWSRQLVHQARVIASSLSRGARARDDAPPPEPSPA